MIIFIARNKRDEEKISNKVVKKCLFILQGAIKEVYIKNFTHKSTGIANNQIFWDVARLKDGHKCVQRSKFDLRSALQ